MKRKFQMLNLKILKSLVVLTSLSLVFLSGCGTKNYNCPPWPYAGPEVAEELETLNEDEYQNLFEWIGRLDKLKDQLD